MSWLTNRVQTKRLRGRNKKKQAKGILLRLRARAEENSSVRFLSGLFKASREQETLTPLKGDKGG